MRSRKKKLSQNPITKLYRRINQRQAKRKTIYKFLKRKYHGKVPCFVCGKHVHEHDASLEHILPISLGGTDDMSNLSISHVRCNSIRGNRI